MLSLDNVMIKSFAYSAHHDPLPSARLTYASRFPPPPDNPATVASNIAANSEARPRCFSWLSDLPLTYSLWPFGVGIINTCTRIRTASPCGRISICRAAASDHGAVSYVSPQSRPKYSIVSSGTNTGISRTCTNQLCSLNPRAQHEQDAQNPLRPVHPSPL
jgi:hypothetical protein